MLLGPVFRAELIRTARRRRYYALRMGYGLALLVLVCVHYQGLMTVAEYRGGRPRIGDVAFFAGRLLTWFGVVQLLTLLFLTPALFGGVIADEKQRRTMHFLMASRLTSGEIVRDKLLARMLHVGVIILLGLPVMSLLGLLGGVAWENVAVIYSATCTITFFTAALATLVSTLARTVRQGVLLAYVMLAAWLIGPMLAGSFCQFVFPGVYAWFGPINDWVLATNPLFVSGRMGLVRGPGWSPGPRPAFLDTFLWMLGLQVVAGVLLLVVAVGLLRPVFRRQEAGSRRLTWLNPLRRHPRMLRRPECGADAMLWKERHIARSDVLTRLVVLPATILLTLYAFLMGLLDEQFVRSLGDVWTQGYGMQSHAQQRLNASLRMLSPWYLGLWLVAVAGSAAGSITVEREQDTWLALVASPLSGWEIVRGKLVGAVWGSRGFGVLLLLIWLAGLAAGALHPVGLMVALGMAGLLTVAVAALGVRCSLSARNTSRAMTATLATLIVLNGGYLIVLMPVLVAMQTHIYVRSSILMLGVTPRLDAFLLFSFDDVAQLRRTLRGEVPFGAEAQLGVSLILLILAAYAIAAVLLTRSAVRRFDREAGRTSYGAPAAGPAARARSSTRPVMVKAAQNSG